MTASYDVIVIGAGQAGLAAGYYLQRAGMRFVLLDGASEIGESWRRRWDSLRLFTPARYNALPGLAFPGAPYSLPAKDDVAAYLKLYANRFGLPVRLRVRVSALHREANAFLVSTDEGPLTASSVIVATGANQRPRVPEFARGLSPDVKQIHSSSYRNPAQLSDGDVLVVGAGNSGAQIALELALSGRQVWLSGRDTGSLPRRLFGRDIYDWLWPTMMRPPISSWLGRRLMDGRLFSGDPLIGMSRRQLVIPGLSTVGRTVAVAGGYPVLDDGRVLNAVRSIVWCTGFRPDFGWIHLPVFRPDGYPRHHRGLVEDAPGLAFVGLRHQQRVGSSLLGGVAEDAQSVVTALHSRSAAHHIQLPASVRLAI